MNAVFCYFFFNDLIEKEITDINLDINHVIEFIFFHLNMIFHVGWDSMEFWRVLLLLYEFVPK